LTLLALATGCTREQWHRFPSPDDLIVVIPWFAVMHTGIAIQPYKMPRQPVTGTVPVTGIEVVPPAIPQNRPALDRLRNPVQQTAASIERGRDRYDIYCGVCHGVEGRGDGPVAPALANAVRDLTERRMRDLSDGWIYATIVNGFGALMPEYGSKLDADDRWHIVNYVRVLQGAAR
jgi:mono/diheme cytochrome c family protein